MGKKSQDSTVLAEMLRMALVIIEFWSTEGDEVNIMLAKEAEYYECFSKSVPSHM